MDYHDSAFDDFIDDCFVGKDPLCKRITEPSSEFITEMLNEEDKEALLAA